MARLMSIDVAELSALLSGYKEMSMTMTWNEAAGSNLLGGEKVSTADVEVSTPPPWPVAHVRWADRASDEDTDAVS